LASYLGTWIQIVGASWLMTTLTCSAALQFAVEPDPGHGPIRVEIEYRIAAEDTPEFLQAMRYVRRTRRRDGALRGSLFQYISEPQRHVESFLVSSWAEHERQHERAVRSNPRRSSAFSHCIAGSPPGEAPARAPSPPGRRAR
jgi:hypothetical protein